jgi:hypothetical protein
MGSSREQIATKTYDDQSLVDLTFLDAGGLLNSITPIVEAEL